MREGFLEIADDAERLAFYAQHYETIKRGQADAESSYNYLKLEKEILGRAPQKSCFLRTGKRKRIPERCEEVLRGSRKDRQGWRRREKLRHRHKQPRRAPQ
jgi:hypothetical protein